MVAFGLTDQIVAMAATAFVVGAAFNGGVVIWGTLLQRRVPPAMLGRVSSLDFFVSPTTIVSCVRRPPVRPAVRRCSAE